ncbi:hypothetical protein PPGU19_090910 (plasmid) [Paraburkholderia sp. PGU19]|uniref:hypothetical protein n=1 Tax=Paraburkholderia sp. PGU19 TaxID=2735434 RepID=UPI0015DA5BFB|nr:hypothetical protein [Paraburkholderia sp. PGU19]BCG04523.1 hypothetical protein PPGU19_090910 [Paraburkholderia sp. PGU19]
MKPDTRLDVALRNVVNEHVDNNSEYFYQQVMICMVKLSALFIDSAGPAVKEAASVAEAFWSEFVPFENFPTSAINVEYASMSRFIDAGGPRDEHLHARAVRLMLRKYDVDHLDSNIDVFPLFVDYLIKMGCSREAITDTIERCFFGHQEKW